MHYIHIYIYAYLAPPAPSLMSPHTCIAQELVTFCATTLETGTTSTHGARKERRRLYHTGKKQHNGGKNDEILFLL